MNHKSIISRNLQKIKHIFYIKPAYFQGFLHFHNISILNLKASTICSKIFPAIFLETFPNVNLQESFYKNQHFIIYITLRKNPA